MFTFGIITNSKHHGSTDQSERLSAMIQSIQKQQIPEYEIIIVGDYYTYEPHCRCIDFDESIKPAWITRKKNVIAQEAKYDVIVYLHDYIVLEDNWYSGWKYFGTSNWDIAMNIIINSDNTRFRDWFVFKYDGTMGSHGVWKNDLPQIPDCLISPYIPSYEYNKTKYMSISGSYWVVKKQVMINEPLNEELVWGQPEDIEWALRVLPHYKYVMNPFSSVKLLHYKDRIYRPLNEYVVSKEYMERYTKHEN